MERDTYSNFAALKAAQVEDQDYRVVVRRVPGARVAIVAPHAGGIEFQTSPIAAAIAGQDHSLYLFEGLLWDHNRKLHVTSHHFDEPRCLGLLRDHQVVVSIHGCASVSGSPQTIYIGGLDQDTKGRIANALRDGHFDGQTEGHSFPGTEPNNVCNRGATGRGVQLELSRGLRDGLDIPAFSTAVRMGLQA